MIEHTSDVQHFGPRWGWLFFAGPVIWYLYFWLVGLAAGAKCAADAGAVVTWVTIGLLGGTLVGLVYSTWRAGRAARLEGDEAVTDRDTLLRAGFLLGAFFILVAVFVGVPALVPPC